MCYYLRLGQFITAEARLKSLYDIVPASPPINCADPLSPMRRYSPEGCSINNRRRMVPSTNIYERDPGATAVDA